MHTHLKKRPWLMQVKPLWLRNKLFWRLFAHLRLPDEYQLFEEAPLEFAPQVALKLLPSDVGHREIALMGFAELAVSERISELAKAGGLMVDVGANFGYYSCLWVGIKTNNRVIAFEASPNNFDPLRFNISANGFESQIDIRTEALGKEIGTLPFSIGPSEQSGWGGLLLPPSTKHQEPSTIEVLVDTLDNIFFQASTESIAVLKVDTEGADAWVLAGAKSLLRTKRIRHIFFEQNLPRMSALNVQPGEAQNLLAEFGYCVKYIGQDNYYARA